MALDPGSAGGPIRRDIWERLPVEDRLVRVVEASPTALVLSGLDGQIEMVNRQCERMFGYDRDELRDKPLEILMPARFHTGPLDPRNPFFAPAGEDAELFGVRKDGSEFPVEIAFNPIDMEEVSMVVASIVDITARRRVEAEKEQQRRELARSNADLEEFAYVASHDLKAPLRAISHLVDWISEDIQQTASPDTMDNLRLLRGRVVRLQMLLDGLLAYARIGRSNDNIENVDIRQAVNDVVAVLAPPPGFEVVCETALPMLRTHRTSLQVVLQNLIGNAIKHHDRQTGRITVSVRKRDDAAEFRVSDDGPGIAPRFHERIFVIFQTLASRDDVEASGIGLAIVKKRIEAHGGRIWVESAPPERGTSFIFTWKESTK